jgi:hypothetical protein
VAPAAEPEWVYSHHAVAFLDLMGQRKVFDGFPAVPETEPDKALLIEKLRHTVGYIESFRDGFTNMFEGMQRERPIPAQIPPEFHAEWRRMQTTEIHLQSVSDAVIAWSPIRPVDEPGLVKSMNGLWGIMMAAAGMTLVSLAAKHPVRGGIDVAGGIPLTAGGNEIYGPALNCAYELESQKAKSPRVLIGPGLLAFLESIESDPPGSRYVALAKTLAERCRGLITEDEDGLPILHFLGAGAREVVNMPQFRGVGFDAAFAFVKDSAIQFRGDAKLGPRYSLLQRYFEKNLEGWN